MCYENHSCSEFLPAPPLHSHGGPSWLVDTHHQCLVSAEPGMSYVDLSYVWGNVSMFTTVRSNVKELQCDQGFATIEKRGCRLPRTILDAFGVTILLGEQYLWIDSLCIVQDEEEEKHTQLNSMGSIYANASVTIVAWQGDHADFGLEGCKEYPPMLDIPLSRLSSSRKD